jgi:hypothetical protein
MTPKLDFEALDDDVREAVAKKLGITQATSGKNGKNRNRRGPGMTKDEVRSYARRVLGVLEKLSQSEIKRVLAQAGKMNDV